MGYAHINNFYKDKRILAFKECIAMEKVHGTSTHIFIKKDETGKISVGYFNGGFHKPVLEGLYPEDILKTIAEELFFPKCKDPNKARLIAFYGEGYGGNMQKMSHIYGKEKRFICFDVAVTSQENDTWLSIPYAKDLAIKFGFEFVPYSIIPATVEDIEAEANKHSIVAEIRGCGKQMREGVVVRPLEPYTLNGARVVCKQKSKAYNELMHPPSPSETKLHLEKEAEKIAENWVTETRLEHVLDKFEEPANDINFIPDVVKAMMRDVEREGEGEIEWNNKVKRAISVKTATLFKRKIGYV